MPELPEVEAIRTQLDTFVRGHKILDVEVRHPKMFTGDPREVNGSKVIKVRRFAKVLAIDLDNKKSLIAHVKMTGQFIYRGPKLKKPPELSKKVNGGVPGKHTHVIFQLDKKGILYYNDIRRFGWIRLINTKDVENSSFIGKLGPEPFNGLNQRNFSEIVGKSKKAIKLVLMDQAKMSGVGNIYANDALWLSGINPKRSSTSLSDIEKVKLYKAILKVLKEGIKRGGTSENAFVTPDGSEGSYQKYFLVYGKENELCDRCKKAKIKKVFLGSRGTYFCPNCQK